MFFKIVTTFVFSVMYLVGCSHSVTYRTQPDHGYLTVEEQSLGKVPPEGLKSTMKTGFGPAPYRLIYVDGFERSGLLARSDFDWLVLGAALAGPLFCTPMMCGAGICAVNPGWVVAVLGGSVVSAGGCQGLMTVASPWTIPLAGSLASIGFLPMGLLTVAERLPAQVVISKIPEIRQGEEEGMPF